MPVIVSIPFDRDGQSLAVPNADCRHTVFQVALFKRVQQRAPLAPIG